MAFVELHQRIGQSHSLYVSVAHSHPIRVRIILQSKTAAPIVPSPIHPQSCVMLADRPYILHSSSRVRSSDACSVITNQQFISTRTPHPHSVYIYKIHLASSYIRFVRWWDHLDPFRSLYTVIIPIRKAKNVNQTLDLGIFTLVWSKWF